MTLEQAQKAFVDRRNESNGCWNWTGATFTNGYGRVMLGSRRDGNRKTVSVHRLAMHMWRGFDLSSPLFVCHQCDNKRCFNPEHLFIGTAADNTLDYITKGKYRPCYGERNGASKLTWDEVRELRESSGPQRILARRFGISQGMVSRILRSKNRATS